MNRKKLKQQKNIHMSILFGLFVFLIVFLFYLAYLFINHQLKFELIYGILPLVIISLGFIPIIQIIRINKKLKS